MGYWSIWLVTIGLLTELFALAVSLGAVLLDYYSCITPQIKIVLGSVLFGGLGGCMYCLRGVYLNACVHKNWDTTWLPWYAIRPVVSLTLGGVSYLFVKSGLLLFGASQQADAGQLGIWAVAFLAGLNVDKFVAKIESIGQTVWGLEPSRQSKPKAEEQQEKE